MSHRLHEPMTGICVGGPCEGQIRTYQETPMMVPYLWPGPRELSSEWSERSPEACAHLRPWCRYEKDGGLRWRIAPTPARYDGLRVRIYSGTDAVYVWIWLGEGTGQEYVGRFLGMLHHDILRACMANG